MVTEPELRKEPGNRIPPTGRLTGTATHGEALPRTPGGGLQEPTQRFAPPPPEWEGGPAVRQLLAHSPGPRSPTPRRGRSGAWVFAAIAFVSAACGSSGVPTDSAFATPAGAHFTLVDTDADVNNPTDVHAVGDSLLVTQRGGRLVELQRGLDGDYEVVGTPVDLSAQVVTTAAEQGLLGVTTDSQRRHLYLNHTRAGDGATVVLEMSLSGQPGPLEATGPRELLVLPQPHDNHNGGDLLWGPDDMLWVATGDGGGAGDPDGRAQRPSDPLGKILRLDPGLPGSGTQLAPRDNPHVEAGSTEPAGANPLVWARGLRNPWRISFDEATGDLWVADVGQGHAEEVSVLRASDDTGRGANLGWDILEGTREFDATGPRSGWAEAEGQLLDPVLTYGHDDGCAVVGGFVYRGSDMPAIEGHYLFSDFCTSRVWALTPDGEVLDLGVSGASVVSLNPDETGEPLLVDSRGISRLTGG